MRTTNALLAEAAQGGRVGAPLASETVLADRFDVSRTAVRAALTRLVQLGVVDREGRISTVRNCDLQQ